MLPSARETAGSKPWVRRPGPLVLVGGVALLLGLAVRLPFILTTDFPLNDGGLFYVMAQEIAAAHFRLPAATAYNLDGIPFAYPPLALYLAAALAEGLHRPLVEVVRYLPLVANLATIAAFVMLAASLLPTRATALCAACAFAIAPRSYEWLVMGGGLTRSLGFLFALGCIAQARALYTRPTRRRLVLAGALAALAWLTHLEMGLFVGYSYLLFFLAYGRSRRALWHSVLLAALALGLTAPWWATVVREHGLAPYTAASATAGWSSVRQSWDTLVDFVLPGQPFLAILGGVAMLGVLASLARGALLLPLWLLCVFVFTPRSAPTEGTVPLALLIGLGVAEVLGPGLLQAARRGPLLDWASRAARGATVRGATPGWQPAAVATGLFLLAAVALTRWLPPHNGTYALEALPVAERQAMAWVAEHTPADSVFLVLSAKRSWEADYVLEWFPALARRKSPLTVQGAEWLPARLHARRACLYNELRAQPADDLTAWEEWLTRLRVSYSHVYLSRQAPGEVDLEPLRAAFLASPRYRVLADDPGATVFERADYRAGLAGTSDGPLMAPDCQTLFDQPLAVQADFDAVFGPRAARVWMDEHAHAIEQGGRWLPLPGTAFAAASRQSAAGR